MKYAPGYCLLYLNLLSFKKKKKNIPCIFIFFNLCNCSANFLCAVYGLKWERTQPLKAEEDK